VFVLTEEQRDELQRINRAWLEAHPAERTLPAPEGAATAPEQQAN